MKNEFQSPIDTVSAKITT